MTLTYGYIQFIHTQSALGALSRRQILQHVPHYLMYELYQKNEQKKVKDNYLARISYFFWL